MKAAIVAKKGGPLLIEQRPIPEPGPREVRIKVYACGVCHSDQFVVDAIWPGLILPRVPGHEVAGVVDAIGAEISHITVGERVGVGWYGGHCGVCAACREGDFILCEHPRITGLTHDGGYAEYMLAAADALAPVPDSIPFSEAAPLLCAGLTTFNALRNSGAHPGDLVAVQGLGGLGHLGIQFARAMGFRVAAVSQNAEKEADARELGAHDFINATKERPAVALQMLGGARAILATAVSGRATSELVAGLSRNGALMLLAGTADAVTLKPGLLIAGRRKIQGWTSGQASDSRDTLRFAAQANIRPVIETYPLDKANEAYGKMLEGKVTFRAVLKMANE
ncbi:MAG: alcohol dehydrogenase catalytic domain-containing protein [Acidobacteriota bacterium]|nr:alcohol dehydrogenase catalytic domain-containing protein [Acidobacteriota bacterium]